MPLYVYGAAWEVISGMPCGRGMTWDGRKSRRFAFEKYTTRVVRSLLEGSNLQYGEDHGNDNDAKF
jgi:hypothetical protein